MRRLALLAAAVAMLLFALAPTAQARVVVNEDESFASTGGPLCGGEDVIFGGTVHLLMTSTVDKAGNTHEVVHYNYKKTTAVGAVSGDPFVIREVGNSATNVRPLDPGETTNDGESTFIINGRLIRLGEDGTQSDDTLFHLTVHITQAGNGEVTTQFEKVVFHCD
jgi:hypothetical protein